MNYLKFQKRAVVFLSVLFLVFGTVSITTARQEALSEKKETASIDAAAPSGSVEEDLSEELHDEAFDEDEFYDEEDDAWSEDAEINVADPLAPVNIWVYRFNDKLYFWLLKPVSQAWSAAVPQIMRKGILNFFSNLDTPLLFANCFLQGKASDAEVVFGRFLVNTTVGILGFGDPASDFDQLPKVDEDLGQTLGVWGIGNGAYLVLPFFGPSTIRDAVGRAGDGFIVPTYYLDSTEVSIGLKTLEVINSTSFRIGDYETIKAAALDPYEAMRDGYLQMRDKKVAR